MEEKIAHLAVDSLGRLDVLVRLDDLEDGKETKRLKTSATEQATR